MLSKKPVGYLILLVVLFLAACNGNSPVSSSTSTPLKPAVPSSPPAPFVQATQEAWLASSLVPLQLDTPPTIPSFSPTPAYQSLPSYRLSAVLDYWQHLLVVDEKIGYTNRSSEAIPDLLLMVEPMNYPGSFHLKSLTWQDGGEIADYTLNQGELRIPLSASIPVGGELRLAISYELSLPSPTPSPQTRPIPFGYTARQTNLVDWYLIIPPYIPGKGWLAHPSGYYGEHLAYDSSNFQIDLKVIGTGAGGRPLTVAASAPADVSGEVSHYELDRARNFAFSICHECNVISTTVGTVTVLSYEFPIHTNSSKLALNTTAEALALYSKLYGFYPHKILSVVEADFLDGMEYDGLYFLSKGFYDPYSAKIDGYLTAIAAHETAHEWFYGLVGNDQAMEPWLDEALATYSERLYYEKVHPEELDWWWNYRVNYYQPKGWVNTSIYNPEGNTEAYRSYRDSVYLNGAIFLEELRKLIGDEAFFSFLKDYIYQYSYKVATTNDFFSLLKEHTTVDIVPLMNKYFNYQ